MQVSAHGTGARIPPVDEQVRDEVLSKLLPRSFRVLLLAGHLPWLLWKHPRCPSRTCKQVVAMKLVTPALGTIELSKVGTSPAASHAVAKFQSSTS